MYITANPSSAATEAPPQRRPRLRTVLLLTVLSGVGIAAGIVAFQALHDGPDSRLREALEAVDRGATREAERLVELFQQQGRYDEARLVRGKLQTQEALELFNQAYALEQYDDVDRTRQRRELKSRARAAFRRALNELAQIKKAGLVRVEAAKLAGKCHIGLEQYLEAAQALTYVIEHQPDEEEIHRQLASIFDDLGAMSHALRHLREVARLAPEDGRPFRRIALIENDHRQFDEAIAGYREALRRQLMPAVRVEVIQELALLLIEHEASKASCQEALDLLSAVPEPFGHRPETLALKAECLEGVGLRSEAIQLVETSLRAEPDQYHALVLRARLHLDEGQPEKAQPLLEKAVRLNSLEFKGRASLAQTYRLLGQRVQTSSAGYQVNHGVVDAASSSAAGLPIFSLWTVAWPTAAERLLYLQADEQLQLWDVVKAQKELLSKLNAEARNRIWDDQVRYEIALIWLKLDRPAEARTWLQAALMCNPQHAQAKEALERLEQLPAP